MQSLKNGFSAKNDFQLINLLWNGRRTHLQSQRNPVFDWVPSVSGSYDIKWGQKQEDFVVRKRWCESCIGWTDGICLGCKVYVVCVRHNIRFLFYHRICIWFSVGHWNIVETNQLMGEIVVDSDKSHLQNPYLSRPVDLHIHTVTSRSETCSPHFEFLVDERVVAWITLKSPSYLLMPYPKLGTRVKAVPGKVTSAVCLSFGPTVPPRASPSMSLLLPDFKKELVSHVGSTLTKPKVVVIVIKITVLKNNIVKYI